MKRMRILKCNCLEGRPPCRPFDLQASKRPARRPALQMLLMSLLVFAGCAGNKPGESAEQLYVRGRAIEDRTAGDAREAHENLREARDLYTQALERRPSHGLEAYIR